MATYKEIKGTQIEVLASDPSNPVEGQVWYNSTSNVLKGQAATTVGAWATGGSLNTARFYLAGAGASNSSGLAFGGRPYTAATESYDGSTWTSTASMPAARTLNATSMGTYNTQSGMTFGGSTGGATNTTIEFTGAQVGTQTLTTT